MAPLSHLAEVGFVWDGSIAPASERVRVTMQLEPDALVLYVEAPYHGDPPPPGPPGSTDGLWRHEVVEVFVTGLVPGGQPTPYLEIELSPHGHHLVLDLVGVRNAVFVREELPFEATIRGDRWRGTARVPRRWLPARPARFNVFSIHGEGAERRYLAMAPVPGPRVDFHRLGAFAVWPFR